MLAILTSRTGLIGMALALVFGAIFVQTARLNHAKRDLTAARAELVTFRASLKLSEDLRSAEYAKATASVAQAEAACAQRVAAAIRSGAAIKAIIGKPVRVDPNSHCPLRSIVGAGELRDALQPAP